jgi:hypothetical protein
VHLYALGVSVPQATVGGHRIRYTGTSSATPQVTNLAGKLLALCATLSVAELRATIMETASLEGAQGLRVVHPRRAIEHIRGRRCETRTGKAEAMLNSEAKSPLPKSASDWSVGGTEHLRLPAATASGTCRVQRSKRLIGGRDGDVTQAPLFAASPRETSTWHLVSRRGASYGGVPPAFDQYPRIHSYGHSP